MIFVAVLPIPSSQLTLENSIDDCIHIVHIFKNIYTRELVGATAIIDKDYPEYILSDKLWKIQFNDLVNVYYMKAVLSSTSIRSKFSESSTGTSGSMFNVSMEKFKSVRIPIAPIEFQNQYRDFVCAIDKSKF